MSNIYGKKLNSYKTIVGWKTDQSIDNPKNYNFRERLQEITYHEHYDKIMLDVLDLFKYDDLPETIRPEHIEKTLFRDGHCVITKHKITGELVALPCSLLGHNVNGDPTKFKITINETNKNNVESYYTDEGIIGIDGILIRNNKLYKPTAPIIEPYVYRLTDIDLTIDTNLFALRTPFIFEVDEDTYSTAIGIMDQYETFKPAIMTRKNKMDRSIDKTKEEFFKVLDTKAPELYMNLQMHKENVMNELYTRLGIDNVKHKKERMVVDEAQANDEQINSSQSISLKTREEDIERVNKLFGLNITVTKGEEEVIEYESDILQGERESND